MMSKSIARAFLLSALVASTSMASSASANCYDVHDCEGNNPFKDPMEDFGGPGDPGFGFEVKGGGESGEYTCDGTCSVSHDGLDLTITDDADGDTLTIENCESCTATVLPGGRVVNVDYGGGWFGGFDVPLGTLADVVTLVTPFGRLIRIIF